MEDQPGDFKRLPRQKQKQICWSRVFAVARWLPFAAVLLLLLWNLSDLTSRFGDADDFDRVEAVDEVEVVFANHSAVFPLDLRFSHPFEALCRFPNLQSEDPSIERHVKHRRGFQCPPAEFEAIVTQSRTGELLAGRPFKGAFQNALVDCFYRELGGALWPAIDQPTFVGSWKKLPLNRRLFVAKDSFAVKCWHKRTQRLVYNNAFANIREKKEVRPPPASNRLNVAILQIDSTSRNQFFRHMPHTLEFMNRTGFQVGDNSAINTLTLLGGMGFELEYRGLDAFLKEGQFLNENQTRGDVFKHVDFVFWKMQKEGCATMWNDDPGKPDGGLFHYQAFTGFRRLPTDFYFRPYYTYLYKHLNAQSVCVNGEFMIPKWLQLWERQAITPVHLTYLRRYRFSTAYKDRCHFSFNHFSFFTHANGNNLELYDEPLRDALERMERAGVLENTVLLIMGDHGQRIHPIKHSYYGKVEERMPLAAVFVPPKVRAARPEWTRRLAENTNRFTSTFDLHETLRDLVDFRADGSETAAWQKRERVGISLFAAIPKERGCADAKVPSNFCVCMEPLTDLEHTRAIQAKLNVACVAGWDFEMPARWSGVFGVTPLVRYGPRYLEQWTQRLAADPNGADILREIVELEYVVDVRLRPVGSTASLRMSVVFRFQFNRQLPDSLPMIVEPWVSRAPCSIFRLDDLCSCFSSD
ncbi:hypothetical protein M3Y99_01332700 [Aphelenchoides fujianensis]|nr:hypothetical protein M3Y99_01332700 [Aphelenchoides fujianensis]